MLRNSDRIKGGTSVKINFIRHGMTSGNLEKRYIGKTDEPLCTEGITALKSKVYPIPGTLICSPMKRCIQTANLIFPGIDPLIYPELRECDFGDFEGKNYRDLNGNEDYQRWIDSGGTLPFPGGESPEDFRRRSCEGFLRAVSENKSSDAITFVVHGGTIMAVMERFAIPKRGYFDWQVANGCGFSAEFNDKRITLISEIK